MRLSPDAERGDAAEGSAGRAGEPICLQHCDESARARWRAQDIWAAKSEQLMQAVEAENERDRAELAASAPVVTGVGLGQAFLADSTESTPTPPQGKSRVL